MAVIAGSVELIWSGRRVELKADSAVEVVPFTVQRETILSQSGAVGSKKTGVAPSLKVTVICTPDLVTDLRDLYDADDVSVVATLASGQTFAMDGAHAVGAPPIDFNSAEHQLELHGTTATLG